MFPWQLGYCCSKLRAKGFSHKGAQKAQEAQGKTLKELSFLCFLCLFVAFCGYWLTRMQTSVAGNAFPDPRLIHATIV